MLRTELCTKLSSEANVCDEKVVFLGFVNNFVDPDYQSQSFRRWPEVAPSCTLIHHKEQKNDSKSSPTIC